MLARYIRLMLAIMLTLINLWLIVATVIGVKYGVSIASVYRTIQIK